ncbi:MAG: ankyrin repeat domain-containing protein, partial [Betaproteobacteria bacterium]|nr:ankyrin repeat domain-containing protein [Betaproteobacteria bacterium]
MLDVRDAPLVPSVSFLRGFSTAQRIPILRSILTVQSTLKRAAWLAVMFWLSFPVAAISQSTPGTEALDPTASQPIFEAIRRDEVFRLMRIIDTEFRTKALPSHPLWGSLLHSAAAERAPQCLRYLLSRSDLPVDASNLRGETALMLAAKHGDLAMAEQLRKRGAEINRPGWTALHYAAAFGHTSMVDWLLGHDAYIDAESPGKVTPLM